MFQLTTSRRGRQKLLRNFFLSILCFNSRPHEEVDRSLRENGFTPESFNSRPHEEVDVQAQRTGDAEGRRFNSRPHEEVDNALGVSLPCSSVSTHDLTKRSTLCSCCRRQDLKSFQLTTSRRGRRQATSSKLMGHMMFQLTTSRRGRPFVRNVNKTPTVSTHDLTKRSTMRLLSPLNIFPKCFNSRPHEEVDVMG